jgi:hypothetical protein
MDGRYELAYREAVRTIDDQLKTVDAVRARAGTLFSAAGVVAAVLGFAIHAPRPKHLPGWVLVFGLSSFVVLTGATLAIWWPTKRGRFLMESVEIVGEWIEGDDPVTLDEMYRDLALHHGANARANGNLIDRFMRCFVVGMLAFAGVVVALVIAVWEVT